MANALVIERIEVSTTSTGEAGQTMALPVIVYRIARHDQQARAYANQILEVGATTEVTTVHRHHLDKNHNCTRDHTESLQREVTTARAKFKNIECVRT